MTALDRIDSTIAALRRLYDRTRSEPPADLLADMAQMADELARRIEAARVEVEAME